LVHAAAHITGGGLLENVPRVVPPGLGARIERGTWTEPPIFDEIRRRADATDADMLAIFNMGIGMVLVVGPGEADEVLSRAGGSTRIGDVVPGSGVRFDRAATDTS
jgi:phosphoribosylformylglycinamidine cyclo-ligase